MRKSILLVFPLTPYPARENGISIRYTPIIEHLSKSNDVHVAIICVGQVHQQDLASLRAICASVRVYIRKNINPSAVKKVFLRARSLFSGYTPHGLYCYDWMHIEDFFIREVVPTHFDTIVWVSNWYIDIGMRVFDPRKIVLDSIDSSFLHHARLDRRGFIHAVDGRKLKTWERSISERVAAMIYISPVDARAFADAVSKTSRIEVIPNGVYIDDFQYEASDQDSCREITLGFIGNMGYPPNIAAAKRLVEILAKIKEREPFFRLLIIGRSPVPEVEKLSSDDVVITGTVESIWPYVNKVDYFVFPMISGAGQQNKVLEAMYAEKVVICSPMANGGIRGVNGEHLLICETNEEFVNTIVTLKSDPTRARQIAQNARKFVIDTYSWQSILPRFEAILESISNRK